MHFTSSSNFFVLKMHLLIHLFILNKFWTGRQISGRSGASAENSLDSVNSECGRRVYSKIAEGL
jgi:hypothetical protein